MQGVGRVPGAGIAGMQHAGIDLVAVGIDDLEPAVATGGNREGVLSRHGSGNRRGRQGSTAVGIAAVAEADRGERRHRGTERRLVRLGRGCFGGRRRFRVALRHGHRRLVQRNDARGGSLQPAAQAQQHQRHRDGRGQHDIGGRGAVTLQQPACRRSACHRHQRGLLDRGRRAQGRITAAGRQAQEPRVPLQGAAQEHEMFRFAEIVGFEAFQHLDRQMQPAAAGSNVETPGFACRTQARAQGRRDWRGRFRLCGCRRFCLARRGEQIRVLFTIDHWLDPLSDCACAEFGN